MTRRFGIDTSGLVRLLSGRPPAAFKECIAKLSSLVADGSTEILASNQVIGEAYVAVQHHYGITKLDARLALLDVLDSGLVAPQNGGAVILAPKESGGAGLFDRLIADGYSRPNLPAPTLDRRMAKPPNVRRL